jgi:hypothetical protein
MTYGNDILDNLSRELLKRNSDGNIKCFLVYGSLLVDARNANDADIIVVVEKFTPALSELLAHVLAEFEKVDFHVYLREEVEGDVSFFTREYVLEYLAKGLCLCGENIFKACFSEVTEAQYKESIFIRSVEHVQMTRKVFFSNAYDDGYKIRYIQKYSRRLSINTLLFLQKASYDELSALSYPQVLALMREHKLLQDETDPTGNPQLSLQENFDLFCALSRNLLDCRRSLAIPLTRVNRLMHFIGLK